MSSKGYNKLYAKRGRSYLTYCQYYFKADDTIIIEHKATLLGKILLLLMYPFVFIINFIAYGMSGVKDFNSAFIPKIKGEPFSQDACYPRHEKYWKESSEFIETGKFPSRYYE